MEKWFFAATCGCFCFMELKWNAIQQQSWLREKIIYSFDSKELSHCIDNFPPIKSLCRKIRNPIKANDVSLKLTLYIFIHFLLLTFTFFVSVALASSQLFYLTTVTTTKWMEFFPSHQRAWKPTFQIVILILTHFSFNYVCFTAHSDKEKKMGGN